MDFIEWLADLWHKIVSKLNSNNPWTIVVIAVACFALYWIIAFMLRNPRGNSIYQAFSTLITAITDGLMQIFQAVTSLFGFAGALTTLFLGKLSDATLHTLTGFAIVFLSIASYINTFWGLSAIFGWVVSLFMTFGIQVSIVITASKIVKTFYRPHTATTTTVTYSLPTKKENDEEKDKNEEKGNDKNGFVEQLKPLLEKLGALCELLSNLGKKNPDKSDKDKSDKEKPGEEKTNPLSACLVRLGIPGVVSVVLIIIFIIFWYAVFSDGFSLSINIPIAIGKTALTATLTIPLPIMIFLRLTRRIDGRQFSKWASLIILPVWLVVSFASSSFFSYSHIFDIAVMPQIAKQNLEQTTVLISKYVNEYNDAMEEYEGYIYSEILDVFQKLPGIGDIGIASSDTQTEISAAQGEVDRLTISRDSVEAQLDNARANLAALPDTAENAAQRQEIQTQITQLSAEYDDLVSAVANAEISLSELQPNGIATTYNEIMTFLNNRSLLRYATDAEKEAADGSTDETQEQTGDSADESKQTLYSASQLTGYLDTVLDAIAKSNDFREAFGSYNIANLKAEFINLVDITYANNTKSENTDMLSTIMGNTLLTKPTANTTTDTTTDTDTDAETETTPETTTNPNADTTTETTTRTTTHTTTHTTTDASGHTTTETTSDTTIDTTTDTTTKTTTETNNETNTEETTDADEDSESETFSLARALIYAKAAGEVANENLKAKYEAEWEKYNNDLTDDQKADTETNPKPDREPSKKELQNNYNEASDRYLADVASSLIANALVVFQNNTIELESHSAVFEKDEKQAAFVPVPSISGSYNDLTEWNAIISYERDYSGSSSAVTHQRAITKLFSRLDGQKTLALLGLIVAVVLDVTIIMMIFIRGRRVFPDKHREMSLILKALFIKPSRNRNMRQWMALSFIYFISSLLALLAILDALKVLEFADVGGTKLAIASIISFAMAIITSALYRRGYLSPNARRSAAAPGAGGGNAQSTSPSNVNANQQVSGGTQNGGGTSSPGNNTQETKTSPDNNT